MPTSPNNGTQTATIDTEHTLATVTTAGSYELLVDLTNLAADDVVLLRAYVKVLTGGSYRLVDRAAFGGPVTPTNKVARYYPIGVVYGVQYTLEQTDGTGRNFDWAVVRLDA